MGSVRKSSVSKKRFASVAILGLCKLFVPHEVAAGQPFEKVGVVVNQPGAARPSSTLTTAAARLDFPAARLDLRAPSELFNVDGKESYTDTGRRGLIYAKFVSRPAGRASESASASAGGHIMSPIETIAHNFQRQGLPLAKLFESKDSLVHLGLNQKGKPGLWLVHKLH